MSAQVSKIILIGVIVILFLGLVFLGWEAKKLKTQVAQLSVISPYSASASTSQQRPMFSGPRD